MDWLRWHHGTVTDPKWRSIKRRANSALSRNVTGGHGRSRADDVTIVTVTHVLAVWATMLESASQAADRGTLEGWDAEDVAELLEIEIEIVQAIYDAMQGKVLDDKALTGWKKRQVKQEDIGAADRKRRQRERGRVTDRDDDHITDGHAVSRNVTARHDRGEERREDKKEPPYPLSEETKQLRQFTDDIAARVGTSTSQSTQWATGEVTLARLIQAGISRETIQAAADEAAATKSRNGEAPPGPAYVAKIAERLHAEQAAKPIPPQQRPDWVKIQRYLVVDAQRGKEAKALRRLGATNPEAANAKAREIANAAGIHLQSL